MQQADAKYRRSAWQCLFSSVLVLMLAMAGPVFAQEEALPDNAPMPPAAEIELPPEAADDEVAHVLLTKYRRSNYRNGRGCSIWIFNSLRIRIDLQQIGLMTYFYLTF